MSIQRIHFFNKDSTFRPASKTRLRTWLKESVLAENQSIKEISYIFCSDAYLLDINRRYLDHDTYTDIITFDNSEEPGQLVGDIFISAERLKENAARFKVSEEEELLRVMIHGILHLCGYKDKSKTQKKLMREKEDTYIRRFKDLSK